MSLFQCEHCGCRENTALSGQGCDGYAEGFYDWVDFEDRKGKKLCSVCAPTKFGDGSATEFGKWHGQFPRVFLPMGEFITNRRGNLEHKATGSEDWQKFALDNPATAVEAAPRSEVDTEIARIMGLINDYGHALSNKANFYCLEAALRDLVNHTWEGAPKPATSTGPRRELPLSRIGTSAYAWGVTRDAENPMAATVCFRSEPSDDDLRILHEALRPEGGVRVETMPVRADKPAVAAPAVEPAPREVSIDIIRSVADGMFDHLRFGDKIPSLDRDGLREVIGSAIAEAVDGLFGAIKHGDSDYQAWLKAAIDSYFAGRPVQVPALRAPAVDVGAIMALHDAAAGAEHQMLSAPLAGPFFEDQVREARRKAAVSARAALEAAFRVALSAGGTT